MTRPVRRPLLRQLVLLLLLLCAVLTVWADSDSTADDRDISLRGAEDADDAMDAELTEQAGQTELTEEAGQAEEAEEALGGVVTDDPAIEPAIEPAMAAGEPPPLEGGMHLDADSPPADSPPEEQAEPRRRKSLVPDEDWMIKFDKVSHCYAMLCYAMMCCAMLCYAMLCYAVLCFTIRYCAMLYYHI
jgi:hypothetical protein